MRLSTGAVLRSVVSAHHRRQIGQVAGHQGDHARRRERHQPRQRAGPQGQQQRSAGRRVLKRGTGVGENHFTSPAGSFADSCARRSTTGRRSWASSSRRNTAATRCWRSNTKVAGMAPVGNFLPNAMSVRIDGS
ncbi:Uncharacterised protein [Mycobacteroides abscessus subsp. abscessus]|nr:Uncharacterised protein [Mycobacteroides abscessus subsp. abscessus]